MIKVIEKIGWGIKMKVMIKVMKVIEMRNKNEGDRDGE